MPSEVFDRYRRTALGAQPQAGDPLDTALAQLTADVERQRWASLLAPLWQRTVTTTLTAMATERTFAAALRDGTPPDTDEHLRPASRSSGLDFILLPLWAGMPDLDLPRHLPVLTRALPHACTAVRLANDISGQDREKAEGVISALSLGMLPHQAHTAIAHHTEQFQGIAGPLITARFGPAVATERMLRRVLRIYRHATAHPNTAPEGLA